MYVSQILIAVFIAISCENKSENNKTGNQLNWQQDKFKDTVVPVPSQEDRAAAAGWSKGGNWMDQHEDINRIGQTSPDIDIVFLGNSITQSLGGPGRNVWSSASDIRNEFFGHLMTANFGISGDRTQHILWRIDHGNFDNINPRIIVLMIGTNNLSHDPAEDISNGIEAVIDRLENKVPGATVLLMSIIRGKSEDDSLRQKAGQVNRMIRKLDKRKNVQYIDLTKVFYIPDGQANVVLMRNDFVHFSLEGYRAWAEILQPYLQELEKQ